jgi:hypothetical protein
MRIEISRRLVRDDKRRPMDQSAGNGSPLLLAAAQLMDEMIFSLLQSHQLDQLVRALFAFGRRRPLQKQRQRNILAHVHRRQEIEELENEPDLPAAKLRQGRVIRRMQREALDENFPARRAI